MAKYVFVTGGVVSGLGKGITASSIALLLKSRGYKVFMQKVAIWLIKTGNSTHPKASFIWDKDLE